MLKIVGIKLVFPSVTTLSNISDSTELRAIQCLPGNTVSTGQYSVYRAIQCLPSSGLCSVYRAQGSTVVTEYSTEHSGYRVQHRTQWSPSTTKNTVVTEYSIVYSIHRVTRQEQCSPRNSVYRVNLLYRVSSGHRVQNYSRRLV